MTNLHLFARTVLLELGQYDSNNDPKYTLNAFWPCGHMATHNWVNIGSGNGLVSADLTNVDTSTVRSDCIDTREISQGMIKKCIMLILDIILKIIYLRLQPHLPVSNELKSAFNKSEQSTTKHEPRVILLGFTGFQRFCSWWRHQMEAFSALLALCTGNSRVTGEFTAQRPVTRSFDVFFDLRLN